MAIMYFSLPRHPRLAALLIIWLVTLDVVVGHEIRRHFAPEIAMSASPTGVYRVDAKRRFVLMDEELQLRVRRQTGLFDYRYAALCRPITGDALVIEWISECSFTVTYDSNDVPGYAIGIQDDHLKYDSDVWNRC